MKSRKINLFICIGLCIIIILVTAFLGVQYDNAFVEFEKFETYYGAKIPRGLIKNYFTIEGEDTNSFYAEIYLTKYGYDNFIKQFNEKTVYFEHDTELDEDVSAFMKGVIVHDKTLNIIEEKPVTDIYYKAKEDDFCFCINIGVFVLVPNNMGYTLVVSGIYNKD